jgi:hypothetical protein
MNGWSFPKNDNVRRLTSCDISSSAKLEAARSPSVPRLRPQEAEIRSGKPNTLKVTRFPFCIESIEYEMLYDRSLS